MTRKKRGGKPLDAAGMAKYRQLLADVRRSSAELHRPAPRPGGTTDVAELVRQEIARQRQAEAGARMRAELDRFRGGPCAYCGTTHCALAEPAGMVPGWTSVGAGPICSECYRQYHEGLVVMTDAERRVRMILDVLGLHSVPWAAEVAPDRFGNIVVTFADTPGARPSMGQWAHVDRARLRADWDAVLNPAPPPPVPPSHSEPCPSCGVTTAWSAIEHDNGVGGTFTLYRCVACWAPLGDYIDPDQAVSARAFAVTGRQYVPGIAAALGLSLWKDAGQRRPPAEPFGWWGDVEAKARAKWPDRATFDAWYSAEHSVTAGLR